MRSKTTTLFLMTLLFAIVAAAQTTEFTYQGKLTDGGSPANSMYDMKFRLYDALENGEQIGTEFTAANVSAAAGIFTVKLDFGSAAFDSGDRWLEVTVGPAGANSFTTLTPRQKIGSAPVAIRSQTAQLAELVDCTLCITDAHISSVDGSKVAGSVASADSAANSQALGGVPASRFVQLDVNGNVGIGAAPADGSKLTVGGQVELTSGGIKFPDATTQSTAGITSVATSAPISGNGTTASPLGIQSPLTVTLADRPELQAVTITCSGTGGGQICSTVIPEGKRLVVEHVSGVIRTLQASGAYINVFPMQPGNGSVLYVQSSGQVTLNNTEWIFNSFVKGYYDAPGVNIDTLGSSFQWIVSLSGYYVDLPVNQAAKKGAKTNAAK